MTIRIETIQSSIFKFERAFRLLVLAAIIAGLPACASVKMAEVETPSAMTKPLGDEAMMVFMRPSYFGAAISSSVFRIKDGEPEFLGIVTSGKKIAARVPAGESRFVVIGETANFLDANAAAGKTYYARVSPRMGLWKARFVFEPLPVGEEQQEVFEECKWTDNTPASIKWSQENIMSVKEKIADDLPDYLKSETKVVLKPEDGH